MYVGVGARTQEEGWGQEVHLLVPPPNALPEWNLGFPEWPDGHLQGRRQIIGPPSWTSLFLPEDQEQGSTSPVLASP